MTGGSGNEDMKRLPLAKIISISILVIVITAGSFGLYSFNGDSFDLTNRGVLLVPTGSMDGEPQPYDIETIPVKSLVMVRYFTIDDVDEVDVGDVLTYSTGEMTIVHRVVAIDSENQKLTLKGDANTSTETVTCDQVTGEVVGVAPALGKIVDGVKGTPVVLLLVGAMCAVVAIWCIIEIVRAVRNPDEKDDE